MLTDMQLKGFKGREKAYKVADREPFRQRSKSNLSVWSSAVMSR